MLTTKSLRILLCALSLIVTLDFGSLAQSLSEQYPYQNPNLSMDERVGDLISRLTMAEKISQLGSNAPAISRLGVAHCEYWNEALHGVLAGGMTSFPQAIALSSTWDADLIYRVASAISDEARVLNRRSGAGLTYWSPTINMARDPRWGRTEETYGEDPFLTSLIAQNFIRGMQGNDSKYLKTVATVKHFACNNVDNNRHRISSNVDERSLREYYLPAFKDCVTKAGVFSVMNTYNALNEVPGPVNRTLLTNILRKEWGFPGFVVSDCDAVSDVYYYHEYLPAAPDATALSIRCGTELNCGGTYQYFSDMALQGGLMSVADIDTALSRIFKARFLLGEFDPPSMVPYSSIPDSSVDCQLHRDLALLAAKKAIVLLKNQNAVLPLNKDSINRIAVIGPNANVVQLGGYSGFPVVSVTPLQGIINEFSGPGKTISYSQGCPLYGPVDSNAVKAAVNLAKNADVAIVVCGTDLQLAKEEMDRTSLDLPGIQDTLIQKILEVNPRTIVVLVCGFPLSINRVYEHVPGIVLAWYDGQAQGSAIASVLAGNFNPGGRLSSTWFKSAADLPPMDHYDIKENRTYQYFTGTPLFSFGYGLSYTTFEYSNLVKSKTVLNPADSLLVSLTIKNSGKMAGDEVVQFYVHHDAPPIIRPLKELKGFQRISLQPGESKMVEFYLRNSDLSYYDIKSRSFQVDNGSVDILIGSSSSDIRLADRIQVKGNTLSPTYRLNPLLRFEAEDFELKSKPVEIVACNEGGQSIKVMANNDYVVYKNVDFGSGVTHFDARIELDHGISREGDLEIRLDSIDGQLSGTMKLKSGGNETGYLKYSGLVNGVAGIHDLIIVFRNSGNGFCRMNWFEFRKEVPGGNGNENDVQLFPNPASTQFTLTYNCVENTGFSVDIYSMAGILIKNVHVQAPVTGLNSLAFNTGDLGLEQGMYLVKCTLNGYCKSFKLCVCR